MSLQFGRLITAMITPFDQKGNVNFDEAIRLGKFLVDNGTESIVLAGTTGESPTLTHTEEYELFRQFVKTFKGKAKIIAGTGSNSTKTAIESTQKAEEIGVDGSLQVAPYYNKPSQEGFYQHFKAIAESTKLPIILYNIPGRTGKNVEPETIARLSKIKNIIGVKEAAGSVEQAQKIRELTPESFLIYSGDDALTLKFMEVGACGVISVAAHCAGKMIAAMINEFVSGNKKKSAELEKELMPLFDVLFITSNPTPVKAAMELMGFKSGGLRLPLVNATEEEKSKIRTVLTNLGVLALTR